MCSVTDPSTGLVKDNHPVLELNLSFVSKRGAPLSLSMKTPSGVSLNNSYSLQKTGSVP